MFWFISVLIDWVGSWFDIPTGDMEWYATRSPVWGTVIMAFCIVTGFTLPIIPLWIIAFAIAFSLIFGWYLGFSLEKRIQDPSQESIESEDASLIPWNQAQIFIIGIWVGEFIFIYRIWISLSGQGG